MHPLWVNLRLWDCSRFLPLNRSGGRAALRSYRCRARFSVGKTELYPTIVRGEVTDLERQMWQATKRFGALNIVSGLGCIKHQKSGAMLNLARMGFDGR